MSLIAGTEKKFVTVICNRTYRAGIVLYNNIDDIQYISIAYCPVWHESDAFAWAIESRRRRYQIKYRSTGCHSKPIRKKEYEFLDEWQKERIPTPVATPISYSPQQHPIERQQSNVQPRQLYGAHVRRRK